MGNISSNNYYSERFPLDHSSEVVLYKNMISLKGCEVVDTWRAEYNVFGRTSCELNLTKTNRNNHEQELSISIHDHSPNHDANDDVDFQLDATVKEELVLANFSLNGQRYMQQLPERKTAIEQGGVLKSSSFLYGRDTDQKGLIVISRAKKSDEDEELPYMISVKHYFVASSCSHGVSAAAKIRSGDEGFTVEIEKPSTLLKCDILAMFDDVQGKGWHPNPSTSDLSIQFFSQYKNLTKENAPHESVFCGQQVPVSNTRDDANYYGGVMVTEYANFKGKERRLVDQSRNNANAGFSSPKINSGNGWSPNPGNSAYEFKLPNQKNGKLPWISISRQQNILRYGNHDVCRISLDVVKEKVWRSKPNSSANEFKFSNQKKGKLPAINSSYGAVNAMFDDVKPKSGRPNPSRGNAMNFAHANPSSSISSQQSNSPLISNGGNFDGNRNGSIILNKYSVVTCRLSIVKMVIK